VLSADTVVLRLALYKNVEKRAAAAAADNDQHATGKLVLQPT